MPDLHDLSKNDAETCDEGTTLGTRASQSHAKTPRRAIAELTILAHPDGRRVGERTPLRSLAVDVEFLLSRTEGLFSHPGAPRPRPLGGRYLSRHPMRFRHVGSQDRDPGDLTLELTTTHIRVEADGEPVDGQRTFSSEEVEHGVVLLLARKVVLLLHRMTFPRQDEGPDLGLVGASAGMLRLRREIRRLAPLDVPVLLRGETGTGKELVARALHEAGSRRREPYVAVNMGVLGPSLAASELFGAVRGAYTGADQKKSGYFESAHGGTLFLDEIGEAPPEVQVMLLRALESQHIVPVGSTTPIPVDVRVIAATDARLEEAIQDHRFRAPLYHRLSGYALRLPPLRERLDDLGRLLSFFLDEELTKLDGRALIEDKQDWPPAQIVARLARHTWPGNVRELRNVARRLAIVGADVTAADLDDVLGPTPQRSSSTPTPEPDPPPPQPKHRKMTDIDEAELLAALKEHRWEVKATARALNVSRPNLYRLMEVCPSVRKAKDLRREDIEAVLSDTDGNLEAAAIALEVSLNGLKRRIRFLHSNPDSAN